MTGSEEDDVNTREVIAGLRAQLTDMERARDAALRQEQTARAELETLRTAVNALSSAWRHLTKNLG